MRRIQNNVGKNADIIDEENWRKGMIEEMNDISRDITIELEKETGVIYDKTAFKPNS
jgi:hypothetical protein